jgi:hypothetical protein
MYSKNQLADLVIEGLAGGAAPDGRKWHRNAVRVRMDGILSEAVAKIVRRDLSEGNYTIESTWVKPFDKVYIKWDSGRKQCYVTFPARIIALDSNRGLREVQWRDSSTAQESFRIIDGLAQNVFSNLESGVLPDGVFFAAVEGDRIYFPGMTYLYPERKAAVRIKMICGSDGFDNNEPLPIPDELANTIIDTALRSFDPQRRQFIKVTNDKNPGTV